MNTAGVSEVAEELARYSVRSFWFPYPRIDQRILSKTAVNRMDYYFPGLRGWQQIAGSVAIPSAAQQMPSRLRGRSINVRCVPGADVIPRD